MYAWIWRHLPGSGRAKLLAALVLAVAVTGLCFGWVFPAVSDLLPDPAVVVTGPRPDPAP